MTQNHETPITHYKDTLPYPEPDPKQWGKVELPAQLKQIKSIVSVMRTYSDLATGFSSKEPDFLRNTIIPLWAEIHGHDVARAYRQYDELRPNIIGKKPARFPA